MARGDAKMKKSAALLALLALILGQSAGAQDAAAPLEEVRGKIETIDAFRGVLRLSATPIPLAEGAEFADGQTGRPLGLGDLKEGDWLFIRALWTSAGQPLARRVERNGNPPPETPALWATFGKAQTLADGRGALVPLGKEWVVAFDAPIFRGANRTPISFEEVKAGEEVAMKVRHDPFGPAVVEIHAAPPAAAREPEQPFWDYQGRLFDVDPVFRLVRFAQAPFRFDPQTEFADAFGFPIQPEDLVFGDPLVLWIDTHTWTTLKVEIQEPGKPYEFTPAPGIDLRFGSLDRLEGDQLYTFEPHNRNLALDAAIRDEESGRTLGAGDLGAYRGQYVRARVRQFPSGEYPPGEIITELVLNPAERPPAPGEKPRPTQVFNEWEDFAVLAEILPHTEEIARTGLRVRVGPQTRVADQNGARLELGDLRRGTSLLIDGQASVERDLVFARAITANPFYPPEGFPQPLFTASLLEVRGEELLLEGGRWWLADEARLFDGQTGRDLELKDLAPGDFARLRLQNTNAGSFILELERNPRQPPPVNMPWEGEFAVFSVERDHGAIRFAGPQISYVARTQVLDREGRSIRLEEIPLGEAIVIVQAPSASGGAPVARSVEIQRFDRPYEGGANLLFTTFAGLEGNLILTADHPRYLAADGRLQYGSGAPARLEDLGRGTRVRAVLSPPPFGLYSPFGEVITQLTLNPQEGSGYKAIETGELEGIVTQLDPQGRTLGLEGPVVGVDNRTEIIGLDRRRLGLEELAPGAVVAVNFFPAPDMIRATRISVLDPARAPRSRPDLIVAPVQEADPGKGLLRLEGPFFSVAPDAELRGRDGASIGLDQIAVGDRVRLQAREEGGGAVALRIKIAGGFEGPLFGGGGLEITSTFPEPEEAGVPTSTAVEVTFNQPVRELLAEEGFDFGLFPRPPAFGKVEISRDGRTLVASAELEENTVYQLFVASERFGLFTMDFTTGQVLPQGEIRGRIELPPDLPAIALEHSGVFLLDAAAREEVLVRGAPLDPDGKYRLAHLADGAYLLRAEVAVELGGQEPLVLEAYFDPNGDGEPDPVRISGGRGEQVDLEIRPPAPLAIARTFPADGAVLVPLASTLTISFSQPLQLDARGRPAVEGVLLPRPLSGSFGPEDLVLSPDRTTLSLGVELEPNRTYYLLISQALSERGFALEKPAQLAFTTGSALAEGTLSGRLALPARLPAERLIPAPALVALVPFARFDPLDPELLSRAVAGALAVGGSYEVRHLPPGRYVATASAQVALPPYFRPPGGRLGEDFAALAQPSRPGQEPPADFAWVRFFGYALDERGQHRDLRPGTSGVDFLLRPEDARVAALRVEQVEPSPESLLRAPQRLDLALEFSEPLVVKRNFVELDAVLRPQPLSGPLMEHLAVEEGGRRAVFRDLELAPNTSYRLSMAFARGVSGQELAQPFNLAIQTAGAAALQLGAVRGALSLDGDALSRASVFLYDPQAEGLEIAAGAVVEEDGTYLIEEVVAGRYAAYAEIHTAGGQDLLVFYDPDRDGEQDLFAVAGGAEQRIDFSVAVQAAAGEAGGGPNAGATATLDLDPARGDQGLAKLEAEAGQTVKLAVYAQGVAALSGVSLKVSFDTTQVAFEEAKDANGAETNLLKSRPGTLALFLPARLKENAVEFGGAILSPTAATVAEGEGLVGVLSFTPLEGYTGARLVLEQVIFNSLDKVQDTLSVQSAALVAPPLDLSSQPKGLFSFDFDPAAGDGEQFHLGEVGPGEEVSVEVYVNEAEQLTNYSVKIFYDPEQLRYVSFAEGDFLGSAGGNAFGLTPLLAENTVEFGSAILGPTAAVAVSGSGLVGTLTFTTAADFAETDLMIIEYSTKRFGGQQEKFKSSIFARLSRNPLGRVVLAAGDFDGDQVIGFGDFFLFADAFGRPAQGAEAVYDLDGSGTVDFGDFFIFADRFGQAAAKRPAAGPLPLLEGALALEAAAEAEEGVVLALAGRGLAVRGFAAVVEYDAAAFRFRGADADSEVPLFLARQEQGQVLVLGSRTDQGPGVEGVLARLHFQALRPEARGLFRVRQAAVRQARGGLGQPQELGQVEAGWTPRVFALRPNYPNPFNPATAIGYQLPAAAQVRLEIYDLLGQKVRVLAAGVEAAGFHQVVWDGRDEAGREVASGTYLCRLQAGAQVAARRLLLLR
jgi:hypothetical protein